MFKQGTSGNPKGRPKGARGKIQKDLKQVLFDIVANNIDNIQSDLDLLDPKERLVMMEKFISYLIPKAINQNNINVDKLTETQINQIIDKL